MARTADEIRDALVASVQSTDPTADLDKGPIFDFLVAPVAPELAETERQVDSLRQLTSLQLSAAATTDELNAIGTSFGISLLRGTPSTCRQTFYCYSRPLTDITIPRGSLVGTVDGSLLFVVDENVTLLSGQADSYYVSSRRRYEILVRIVAVASSPDYDLPPFRINRMFTDISGIDGCENRVASTGGVLQQSNADYFRRIQNRFAGLNAETGGGLVSRTYEMNPTSVSDVILVYPKDRNIFFRDISRPALDVYIMGTDPYTTTQTYNALGGETTIPLNNVPVLSVDSVTDNGVVITDFAFLPDDDFATRRSAKANDAVVFSTPLLAGHTIIITYTYNKLISDAQTNLYSNGNQLFDTDILGRMPIQVPITIDVSVSVLQSFDAGRVADSVTSEIYNYCNPYTYVSILLPEVLKQNIITNVSGVSNVAINKFTKSSGSVLDIETISFLKNEVPIIDQTTLKVRTQQ